MIANFFKGLLIGIAEVIPGVSGGTIALIVGIYERILDAANKLIESVLGLLRGNLQIAKSKASEFDWKLIVPIVLGMLTAIVFAAAALEPLLESEPEMMRGLFAGIIAASLVVPLRMAGNGWSVRYWMLFLVATAAAFALTSFPKAENPDTNFLLVFLAAAVAVCALVLPGVSGSFLLLAIGFYEPTIAAVNDRDIAYLGVFVCGAILGLALFARVLWWLLSHYRKATLVVMAGLMLGSLRALWPWQSTQGDLLAPTGFTPLVAAIVGGLIILGIIGLESRVSKSSID